MAGALGMDGSTDLAGDLTGGWHTTLSDGAGAIVGWLGLVVPCKMSIRSWSTLVWLSLNGARGELGKGCWRACTMLVILAMM